MAQSESRIRELEAELRTLRGDAPTTLLGAQAGTVTSADVGSGYVLDNDGGLDRVVVRVATGTDDDGNATYETRLGRYKVDASGALSVEFPARAEEGGQR